jgi:Holliday junction resolvase RusA-like endonuclease
MEGNVNMNQLEFFVTIVPPTVTHQEKKVRVVNGKPIFYEPDELKDARQKLLAHLAKHVPDEKFTGPIQLITKWCYLKGKHGNGEYKTTKPDTDNMIKLLKDVMTELGYWQDDALVASEITEKFWADNPGIYVRINQLKQSWYKK